jgi:hypothetical protein
MLLLPPPHTSMRPPRSYYHSFIHSSTALQPFVGPWPLPEFRNLSYTDGIIPWTGDQPVGRPLPTHSTTQTQNKSIHRHLCFECDSNPRPQCSSEKRQFMPLTAQPPWSASAVTVTYRKFKIKFFGWTSMTCRFKDRPMFVIMEKTHFQIPFC